MTFADMQHEILNEVNNYNEKQVKAKFNCSKESNIKNNQSHKANINNQENKIVVVYPVQHLYDLTFYVSIYLSQVVKYICFI